MYLLLWGSLSVYTSKHNLNKTPLYSITGYWVIAYTIDIDSVCPPPNISLDTLANITQAYNHTQKNSFGEKHNLNNISLHSITGYWVIAPTIDIDSICPPPNISLDTLANITQAYNHIQKNSLGKKHNLNNTLLHSITGYWTTLNGWPPTRERSLKGK